MKTAAANVRISKARLGNLSRRDKGARKMGVGSSSTTPAS